MNDRKAIPGRETMRAMMLAAGLVATIATCANAQERTVVGISAPLSGYFEILGEQVEAGSRMALADRGDVETVVADDACSAEGGSRSAEALIAAKAAIVIGYPCIEAFDAAMPRLAEAGIPVIVLGVQAEGLGREREENNWPMVRLAPRSSDEALALATHLRTAWRTAGFALIDDGTLYGRQLVETVRFLLEEFNLKPVFTDTFRPQLENQVALARRLQKAGATHVVIGGDAFDAAVIGRDARAVGAQLTLAGGSALVAPPSDGTLPDGTIIAALPDWLERDPARDLAAKLPENLPAADGYFVPAHAAAEIALAAIATAGSEDRVGLDALVGPTFETALGPVRFGDDGNLVRNLFEIFVVTDGKPVPAEGDSNTGAIR
ncbi:ABC transporter substrate-binding protein [Oricola thermophila]|uniref:ABC transporter substrate-binding protein n=1 Tax=Oricola thermophila TaxID=2742145 RepID=A0A6N1VEK9_9HYPH|nr:ABC transporter substrate-binding protein [Oricola thermophila]QKV18055.1 ABC transporter substrate-binding protein [Oricola thermophila]